MVVKSLRAPPARVKSADRHLLDKVRTRRYSVLDLFMEVCCLEQSIQEVLGGKSGLTQVGVVQAMALITQTGLVQAWIISPVISFLLPSNSIWLTYKGS